MRKKIEFITVFFLCSILCTISYAEIYVREIICIGNRCEISYDLDRNESFPYIGIFENHTEVDKFIEDRFFNNSEEL